MDLMDAVFCLFVWPSFVFSSFFSYFIFMLYFFHFVVWKRVGFCFVGFGLGHG